MTRNFIGTGLSLRIRGLQTGMDLPVLAEVINTATIGGEDGTYDVSGDPPDDPIFTVKENDGGLSVLLTTVTDGTTNTVQYYDKTTGVWSTAESITLNVAKSLAVSVGYYWVRVNSTLSGRTSVGLDDQYVLGVNDRDAEKFYVLVMATLAADTVLQGIIAQDAEDDYAVYPNEFMPTGNVYPQITVALNIKDSEQAFKAGRYDLQIKFWVEDNSGVEMAQCWNFRERIEILFNREGSAYNIIDIASNSNLRVANIIRRICEFKYDHEHNKHYVDYRFDVTLSEDESHTAANAGDKSWV